MSKILKLTKKTEFEGIEYLRSNFSEMKMMLGNIEKLGDWKRKAGFESLVNIIVEQLLSLKAAETIFKRVKAHLIDVTPENVLKADTEKLRELGMSYSKIKYIKNIARAILDNELDVEGLKKLKDLEVKKELLKIKGIGEWTANVYLLMSLRRLDVWPVGDNALHIAVQKVKNLKEYPDAKKMILVGEKYKPYRTIAARIYWSHYSYLIRKQKNKV